MRNDLLCKARKEKERVKDGAGEMSQPFRASVALAENPGVVPVINDGSLQ